MVVYICTNFHENILDVIKVTELARFSNTFSKGHNSVKRCRCLQLIFSAHPFIMVYTCTKIHENILDGIKVIEQIRFS